MENKGRNYDFYKYKQGVWYMKSDDTTDPDYQADRIFKDIAGNDVKVSGVFVNGLQGKVTGMSLFISEDETYEVLNVILDNKEKLSMSLPSEASRQVIQTFENLDFDKEVNLVAWSKDGWFKLSVKQEDKHVDNSFFQFVDKKFSAVEGTNYPVRPSKDASKKEKSAFIFDEVDFLKIHLEKIVALIPVEEKVESVPETTGGEINPEDVPF